MSNLCLYRSAAANTNTQQPQPQQQQQWQQYAHYSAAPTTNASAAPSQEQQQQYALYYQQQYPTQAPDHQGYYHNYFPQQQPQQQQYSNPPPPGTEAPPGVSQPTAPPGTSNYDYNYSQYPGYYSQQQSYNQQPAHGRPPPPQQQQYQQQQQHSYYNQHQQQRPQRPPPQNMRPPPHHDANRYANAQSSYQAPPVVNKPGHTIPPWSKKPEPPKPVEAPRPVYQPPPPPIPQPQQQPPAPPVQTAEQKSNEKNAMSPDSWPPSLQQYVQDVFANCLPNKTEQASLQLRNLIMEIHQAGKLMTTDWCEMDLPSACNKTPKKKKKGKKNFAQPKNSQLHQKHQPSAEEEAKRLRRLRRFEEDAAQFRAENVSTPLQAMHLDGNDFNQTVVGTSTKFEKQYLRLTSAPDPATVRPLPILKQTLELLKDKWKNEQNYTYICDQFKSMRQDLTVQRIKNEFTVQVYEIHARIALEKSDLGEYNQCQTQLKGLYASGISGNVMEFTAYRILYFLHTQNWADVNSTMADLTAEKKENPFVQHALNVRSSLATSNFHRFFILYKTAPNMGGYLMDQFVERERVQSLIVLCKACRPDLPLDFIQTELGFDSEEELFKFLTEQKAKTLKANDSKLLDTRAALIGLTESLKKYKKIDIKGQV